MSEKEKAQATTGTKKATEPKVASAVKSQPAPKRTKYDLVAVGVCPHDNAKLGDEIHGRGIGVIRVCVECGHAWYINKKIRTCKCLTCSGAKRNAVELTMANWVGENSDKIDGGPFWTRTRDLSLIRTAL